MKLLKETPIRIQLSLLASFIVIAIIIIIFVNYHKAAKVVEKKNNDYFTEMIAQMNQTISSNTDVVKRLVQNISYNSSIVQTYLNETDPIKRLTEYAQLKSYISDMIGMKDGIVDIALISKAGSNFNINGYISNMYPIIDEIPKKQLYHFTGLKDLVFNINTEHKKVIIAGSQIYSTTNFENTGEIGTLMIALDPSALLGDTDRMLWASGSKIYISDRDGNVMFTNDDAVSPGQSYVEAEQSGNDSPYIVQQGEIPDIAGKITIKLPQSELLSGINDIRRQAFIILFLSLLVLSLPFGLVINNITQPLKKFMRLMNEIKLGKLNNLKKRIRLQGYAEIIVVAENFNGMLDEVDDLTHRLLESNRRLYESELAKKQSEIAYLQSQINPHFLYNTLESFKGIAAEEKSERIFNMSKALGLVFRYSIRAADVVTLREELTVVQNYIYLQKIRFEDRLEVEYRIPDELMECKIPKMILQPIVENAIFHGIEPKLEKGNLALRGHRSDNLIILSVMDDGVGISEQDRKRIEQYLSSKPEEEAIPGKRSNSVGLVNVHNRLRLNYGDEYGVRIAGETGKGTEIIMTIPYLE
ncbi:histidine kinase [Cohnella suwonensis]|uniref:Histidine kinase n=1 Tax=Cohnella suwonensis TaxID=696072 RepID=A0ABW0M416_9BACL